MTFRDWNKNYRLAVYFSAALFVWMLSGVFSKRQQEVADGLETPAATELTVVAETSHAEPFIRWLYVRAQTQANRLVDVAAEVEGQVESLVAGEGRFVAVNEPLCVLAAQDRTLRVAQARALLDKAQLDYDGALRLGDGGLQSQTQIAAAKVNLALARAELSQAQLAEEKRIVRAPFAAYVERQFVDAGAFLQRGAPCVRLLELSPIQAVGHVSERDLRHLSLDAEALLTLRDGSEHRGRVHYISKAADAVTRSYRVEVRFDNPDHRIADGMSGDMRIYGGELAAHRVNASLLGLMPNGAVGLKILDADNIVRFVPVELLGDAEGGVWLAGLEASVSIITLGQEYVVPGERARVALDPQQASASGGSARP